MSDIEVKPDLKAQLAQAFGLASADELDGLISRLRSGDSVHPQALRNGCLALLNHLQGDQNRLSTALNAAQVSCWDLDLRSHAMFVDHTWFELLGLPHGERTLTIAEVEQLTHPDDREGIRNAVVDVITGQKTMLRFEHRVRHVDGRWIWMETFGNVCERDADGRAIRLSGTKTNITERKQLERALSNTLRVMRSLLESMPLPVIMRDTERRVTLVNAAWENMLGISRHDIVGQQIEQYPRTVLSDNHLETDLEVLQQKRSLRYETVVHGIDGTNYDVIVAKTPLVTDDGVVTGLAAVVTDISEQKRISAALEKARVAAEAATRAKSLFLANMSHELRTPLNGVVGMASLLENTALDAKQRRFVKTLKSSAEALVTQINDVLDLSKAEAGKLELSRGPFDLRKELDQVVGLFSARAYDKGVEIAAHIARDVPAVINGDPIRLRQVLGNLVNNAVKFTESGAILVAVGNAPSGDSLAALEFSVTDTGVGVAEEEQQRIFEAFEQADGSVTRRFGGTGLGLAICRKLVELMHGSMGVQSSLGHGSRFWFRITAGVPRLDSRPPAPSTETGALLIGLHLVLQVAARETLARECAQVVCTDSMPAAIEALASFDARTRLRVIIDSSVTHRLEQAVSDLRAAAKLLGIDRELEVVALLPPDADASSPPGVSRCLVKPFCTVDLLGNQAATDAGQTTATTTRVRVLPTPGSRGNALVVEDNAVNQEMARAMLDMLGFHVVTASNGREGVQAVADNPGLDLIFMDCQMPVMDGLAAARAIREAEASAGGRVPIVALTGNAMPGDREACVAAGMDDYLAKPFSLTALRAMIDKWVKAA